jgi:RND superfamily putative drug exporter
VQEKRNIAARAAQWSAQHRKKAVFGWLAFVIVAFAVGSFVIGNNTLEKEEAGVGESGRADLAAYKAFFPQEGR